MFQRLNHRRAGFTLVEIMIVVAIIALLAAIAVPNFMRARKRSQATLVLSEMRIIQSAADQYYIDNPRASNVNWVDLKVYYKDGSRLYHAHQASGNVMRDPLGNGYIGWADAPLSSRVGVSTFTYAALSDVAPLDFWSGFVPPELGGQ